MTTRWQRQRLDDEDYDLVVCGGGMAGVCAALAAARQGASVCLVQDRPVLGGNASSEVRVTIHGAACHHAYGRETGIVNEFLAAERAQNHSAIIENGWNNSVHDQVLYDLVEREERLTLALNTVVLDVELGDGASGLDAEASRPAPDTRAGYFSRPACASDRRIASVVLHTLGAERYRRLQAPLFCDATGDGLIAHLAGCAWRMGTESQAEHGELHAPTTASTATMGSSLMIYAVDTGRDAPFQPPDWARHYDDAGFFYEQGRAPTEPRGGFWWIEIGVPWHTISDNETIRHELTRHALGVWDWMKNRDPKMKERCRNYALEFIGQVPGKRESRRIIGRHWITENELQARTVFPDTVAHGGWFVDLHTPGGLLADSSEQAAAEGYADSEYKAKSYIGPYGIPLRALIAADLDNCFLAGRCLSSSKAALGTLRVMGTTALMGQAVGTAAAVCRAADGDAAALAADAAAGGPLTRRIQAQLDANDVFLPGIAVADEQPADRISASSSALLYGQSPGDPDHRHGQGWRPRGCGTDLGRSQGQVFFHAGGRLDAISLCLDHPGGEAVDLGLQLVRLDGIWDYRAEGAAIIASGRLTLQPGIEQWIAWPCALDGLAAGCYRLQTEALVGGIGWRHLYQIQPGCIGHQSIAPSRMRSKHAGHAIRLDPPQAVYGPEQIASQGNRPQDQSNCWRSDPGAGLPQWLELAWDRPRHIAWIACTFAGHLLLDPHAEPPFWRDPQTVRDYAITIPDSDGGWRDLLRVHDNYQRHRRHVLPAAVTSDRLRLTIFATNGDPSATVYRLRCGS